MERLIMHKLLDWKNSPYRKPLILKGVRPSREDMGSERIRQALL